MSFKLNIHALKKGKKLNLHSEILKTRKIFCPSDRHDEKITVVFNEMYYGSYKKQV